jgi:ketosteroid isomerase-like protein
MDTTNAALIQQAYDAFAEADIATVLDTFAPDITWHVPGRSPISGDYKGHDEVLGFFARSMELSGGTLRVVVDEVLADDERVVVLTTVSAERNGSTWSAPEVHVWRVVDGRAVEFREFQGDQQTEDEFWAAPETKTRQSGRIGITIPGS